MVTVSSPGKQQKRRLSLQHPPPRTLSAPLSLKHKLFRLRPASVIAVAIGLCVWIQIASWHLASTASDAMGASSGASASGPALQGRPMHRMMMAASPKPKTNSTKSEVHQSHSEPYRYDEDEDSSEGTGATGLDSDSIAATHEKAANDEPANSMERPPPPVQRRRSRVRQSRGDQTDALPHQQRQLPLVPKTTKAKASRAKKGSRPKRPRPLVPLDRVNDYQFTIWFDPEGTFMKKDPSDRTEIKLAMSASERTSYMVRQVRYETCSDPDNSWSADDLSKVWHSQGDFKDVHYSSEHGHNTEKFRPEQDQRKLLPCPRPEYHSNISDEELKLLLGPAARFKLFEVREDDDPETEIPVNGDMWTEHVRSQVAAFSFWSPSAQREVAISTRNGALRAALCKRNKDCPQDCRGWAKRQLEGVTSLKTNTTKALEMAVWDSKDGSCKYDNIPELIAPNRPFGGECMCLTTCLTPKSQEVRTTWPWANQSQHQYFYPNMTYSDDGIPDYSSITVERVQNHRVRKFTHQDRPVKPSYNCPENPIADADAGSSRKKGIEVDYDLHIDFEHHMFFIPEAKLIFCGIPKVGITEWLKFLRFTLGAGDYLSFPHHKQDRTQFSLSKLPRESAQKILNDPSWTKAVFFRDPAERLLSAYLDKFVKEEYDRRNYHLSNFTVKEIAENGTVFTSTTNKMPFETFIDMIDSELLPIERRAKFDPNEKGFVPDMHGLGWTTDPHWRPQAMTCGLDVLLPHFDFIGSLNHVAEHTKMLLERTNVWETYGKRYTAGPPGVYLSQCAIQRAPSSDEVPPEGFNQPRHTVDGSPAKHATGSKGKMEKYYTPELLEKVRKAYAWDYAIWDDISRRYVSDVPSGRELAHVREYCGASQSVSVA